MVHTCNPSAREVEAVDGWRMWSQPGLHIEFKGSLLSLKNKKKEEEGGGEGGVGGGGKEGGSNGCSPCVHWVLIYELEKEFGLAIYDWKGFTEYSRDRSGFVPYIWCKSAQSQGLTDLGDKTL